MLSTLSDRFFLGGGGEGDSFSFFGDSEAEGERRFFFLHIVIIDREF
jgi:hypothetical protein